MKLTDLPVYKELPSILESVQNNKVTLLTATPGSGKTLLVAPYILKNTDLRIAMLQPRRVAAKLSTEAIGKFNNWQVGEDVGLIMKNTYKMGKNTRLTIMTEGVLSRMLSSGEVEKRYDLIILDEFHERSVHTDLACAWAKIQNKTKFLIMSATLDSSPLQKFFPESFLISIEGRLHPITNHYIKQSLNYHDKSQFNEKVAQTCLKALDEIPNGNILVFLPGRNDIRNVGDLIQSLSKPSSVNFEVHHLYSGMKSSEQNQALSAGPIRKIILSTNIAETSLTLPDVKAVIDSGLHKEASFNPMTGVQTLSLQRIPLDSAVQRGGRAGRLGPGTCYKMWTPADEQRFKKTRPAEVQRVDPIDLFLTILGMKFSLEEFHFFEVPKKEKWELAKKRLDVSGCVDSTGLTQLGRWVSQFPGNFSEGLLAAISLNKTFLPQALLCIIILREGAINTGPGNYGEKQSPLNLKSQLGWLKDNPKHPYHIFANKLKEQARRVPISVEPSPQINSLEEALVFSFPHRICRFRNEKKKSAIMSTGRGVKFSKPVDHKKRDFFIGLQIFDQRLHGQKESEVRLSFFISKNSIKSVFTDSIKEVTQIDKNKKKNQPKAFVYQAFWDLPLEAPRGLPLDKSHMISFVKSNFIEDFKSAIKDYPNCSRLVERINFCQHHKPELNWPTFSKDELHLIVDAAYSDSKQLELSDEDWFDAIVLLLDSSQIEFMNSFAPENFATKIRKRNQICYQNPEKPKVSIILQEAFELKTSPMIGNGQVTLAVEFLAPSRKPIEVSSNLEQFWVSSYPDIRKQYRGRYPKHSWPEEV